MAEFKARLVDKDGNPLGTALNPLKISGGGSGGGTWGSITGTLSNQTDLQNALDLKVNTSDLADVGYSSVSESVTLPASPDTGEIYEMIGTGTNWVITANTGQYIRMLSALSASAGTLSSTSGYDCVTLIYIGSNVWLVKSHIGILEVV